MIDTQMVEYIAYGIVGLMLFAALVLGIINWIHLFSLSSQVVSLENEVEKKTFEFANLKKSRSALMPPAAAVKEDAGSLNSDEIRVVRNVRAGIEEEKESFLKDEIVQMSHTPAPMERENVPAAPAAPPAWERAAATFLPKKPQPQATAPIALQQKNAPLNLSGQEPLSVSSGDIMDVIETSDMRTEFSSADDTLRITLYSTTKKDADFEQAFAAFNATISMNAGTPVTVDFSQIMFLYEKELAILEKMSALAQQFGCKLLFVNCDLELKTILQSRKGLKAIISE